MNVQQFFTLFLLACLGLALIYLGATGCLHWLFALLGGLLPFVSIALRNIVRIVQAVTLFRRFRGIFPRSSTSQTRHSGQTSKLQTSYFEMILDHDSGDLNGKILLGHFAGRQLSQLELPKLLELLAECQSDQDSVNVLIAYLDRVHPDWQDQVSSTHNTIETNTLNEQQALAILGLETNASKQDIIDAHRRLIQKVHPDRGGSTYLAARINEAKSFLIKSGSAK